MQFEEAVGSPKERADLCPEAAERSPKCPPKPFLPGIETLAEAAVSCQVRDGSPCLLRGVPRSRQKGGRTKGVPLTAPYPSK